MSVAGRYLVQLPHFEGPLALLLYLIRKEEMDIFNINIHSITKTYLEHIKLMRELDLEVAGDFVAMAATLIHIKARMLLPQYNEEGETVEVEDPRKELVQKLIDYQLYKDASKQLYGRPLLRRDVWPRGLREDMRGSEPGEIIIEDEGLFGLIASYRRAMKKAQRLIHRVRPKTQSIAGRVLEISHRLKVGARVLLRDLLDIGPQPYRNQLLITFLSMLELGRLGFVSLFQNETYGDLHIELKKPIERNVLERVQEFDSSQADQIAESIIVEARENRDIENMVLGDAATDETIAMDSDQTTNRAAEPATGLSVEAVTDDIAANDAPDVATEIATEIATDEDILLAEQELGLVENVIPEEPGGDASV